MNGELVSPGFRGPWRFLLIALAIGAVISLRCAGQETTPFEAQSSNPQNRSFAAGDGLPGASGFFSPPGLNRSFARWLPIFFPPIPPQLGSALDSSDAAQGRRAAPAELAAYVNEPFYAPLSTRLVQEDLGARLRARLDAYRAAKTALQKELRAHLDAQSGADPLLRERALAAFAREQTPRIVALELTAEELRADMISGRFFDDSTDWNELRAWELGVSGFKTPAEAVLAQFQVMRAAAFYQRGLSPAQRRLLREIAMELAEVAGRALENGDNPHPAPVSADTNPLFYFSPETARLRLPLELPAALAGRISQYEREKSELKMELREAVYAQDSAHFDFLRNRALAKLAEKQQPRIDALETLAEEIRRELILLPTLARPPAPPSLPPAIVERMSALLEEKKLAQRSVGVLVRQIKRSISVSRIETSREPDGRAKLSVVISPQDRTEAKVKPVREMIIRYNEENLARITHLEKEKAAIHDDVARFVGAGPDVDDAEKAVRDLTDESYSTIERREEWALYKDYRTAVVEPGLSPEQRRLLFDGGLETLELPLPGADRPVVSLR